MYTQQRLISANVMEVFVTLMLILLGLVVYKIKTKQVWTFHWDFRVAHLIQTCVQSSILLFMSLYSPYIKAFVPYIPIQILFGFIIDFLISIARYRSYRVGLSALPIVMSINLFIWFQPELLSFQFLMITLAFLSKHYFLRRAVGERVHIFNPSAFGMFFGSLFLIYFGHEYSWLNALSGSYNASRPEIFYWILAMGALSQIAGQVFAISFGAVLTLFSFCYLSEWLIGIPLTNQWIDPAVLVGVTLLITDPVTTPKTNWGRFLFGCTYGLAILAAYGALSYFREPGYFAKILSVPIMNYLAPYFDRLRSPSIIKAWPLLAEKLWLQASMYVLIMLILLPSASRPREPSILGALGGKRWSQAYKR